MSYGSFHAHHPHVSDSTFISKASEPTRGACMHLRLFQKVASDELWLIPCTPPACIRDVTNGCVMLEVLFRRIDL